ncbi:MAG: DUF3943 domain-containing protein [Campylobacterota bacterium]|nr:DUF3943 domain-containing protein [Campylobacterota bacterium]
MNELLTQKYISLDDDLYRDYVPNNINVNDNLTQSEKKILEDTLYLQGFMISTIGILYLLPESVTKWDPEQANGDDLGQKWRDNISDGPVIDEDEFAINYIGHPVSGAIYYSMARNDGFDPFESFMFSLVMSSFVWECGYEAFAEIPSIQDLISTPIVGALMGEYMFYLEQELDKNGGLIWGSSSLGNVSYFFLNPMGRAAEGLSDWLNISVTMKFETYQENRMIMQEQYNVSLNKPYQFSNFNYGVLINLEF